jgi:hypothetical protein
MKFLRKLKVCLWYLFTKQSEYEYYNEDGELVLATGRSILDIVEDNSVKDKALREKCACIEQMRFQIDRAFLDLVHLQRFTEEYDNCYHKDKCKYNCGHERYGMCWYYHLQKIIDKLM